MDGLEYLNLAEAIDIYEYLKKRGAITAEQYDLIIESIMLKISGIKFKGEENKDEIEDVVGE